jgi:hypothetical protein
MLSSGMSKMLSGAEDRVSRTESERDGKMPVANAKICRKLRDTRPSAARNCTFLTLAIPGNFTRLSARSLRLPINSARLRAKQTLGAKNAEPQNT